MFKTILISVWDFFCAIGEAKHAADLARNGKWREAQEICRK